MYGGKFDPEWLTKIELGTVEVEEMVVVRIAAVGGSSDDFEMKRISFVVCSVVPTA